MSVVITELFKFILSLFTTIINVILMPIDMLLSSVLPNFFDMVSYVDGFLGFFFNDIVWILQWIHIPYESTLLIMGYITLRVTMFLSVLGYRLVG